MGLFDLTTPQRLLSVRLYLYLKEAIIMASSPKKVSPISAKRRKLIFGGTTVLITGATRQVRQATLINLNNHFQLLATYNVFL